MFGRKKNIGIGQPTWAAVKRETNDRITKNINEMIPLFFYAAYECNLAPRTLKRIWDKFKENVQIRNTGVPIVETAKKSLKEEAKIVIEPYEDWSNDIS